MSASPDGRRMLRLEVRNAEWLAKLDPAKVHEDLVSTAINSRAIEAAGGLSVFGASPTRKELVQP